MDQIPVYFAGRYFVGCVPLSEAEHVAGGIAVRNKRGNITRVNLIALVAITQTGLKRRYGRHMMQHLNGFTIHALSGTISGDGDKYAGPVEKPEGQQTRTERERSK